MLQKIQPRELSQTLMGQTLLAGQLYVTVTGSTGHITLNLKPYQKGHRGVGFTDAKCVYVNVPNQGGWSDKVAAYYVGSGQFYPDRNADPARLAAAEYALNAAAGRNAGTHIKLQSHCFRCGAALTDPQSIDRGLGPYCYGRVTDSAHQTKEIGHTHENPAPQELPDIPDQESKPQVSDTVSISGGQFIFTFHFDWALVDAVKALGPARWDKPSKTWSLPISNATAAAVSEFLAEHPTFVVSKEVHHLLAEKGQEVRELTKASRAGEGSSLKLEGLYPYQNVGVEYALKSRRTFIADEMGLGKTVQALVAHREAGHKRAVVLCKNMNKFNWERETAKWLPDVEVDLVFGRKPYRFDADLVIINYEIVSYHAESLKAFKPDTFILDESQYVKNHKAQRTKAAKQIAKSLQHDALVMLLTGTPVVNRPAELITQLEIMGRLNDLGGWRGFIDRYVGWDTSGYGTVERNGAKNLEELNKRMRQAFFIRRLKKDVLKELPPMTRQVVEVELANREDYKKAEANFLYSVRKQFEKEWEGETGTPEYEKALAQKIHKALAAEQLREAQELRRITAEGKIQQVCEFVQDFLEQNGDEKIVVFAYHRSIQHELVKAFPGCVRIMGSQEMSASKRNEEEQRFWNDPSAKVCVASLEAAKEGVNLQSAAQVLFVELGWTPAGMEQAEARIHRIGQDQGTTSYWMVGKDSFDQNIQDLLDRKAEIVTGATEG